ncbi:MAG TPA: hypothetical protein DCY13_05450 [Verrucomicrobiales bacterium]|nr:hypothetical protein [Verrucomicrobiales bacterium]
MNPRTATLILLLGCLPPSQLMAQQELEVPEMTLKRSVWQNGIGTGFAEGALSIETKLVRGLGTDQGGSRVNHDLWLGQLLLGTILMEPCRPNRWYGGNLELTGQLIGGAQDHPEPAFFVAGNVGLRYHLSAIGRVVPFLTASIGISGTDIGEPDLSGTFQFNEQVGGGLRYFLSERRAIVLEYFFQHISNGSTSLPNHGANSHMFSLGFAWLY